MLVADAGLVGVDLDDCVDHPSLDLTQDEDAVVAALDSYAELRPSGLGVRVIVRGELNGRRNRTGSVELYDRPLPDHHPRPPAGTPATIEERQARPDDVHAHVFGEPEPAPNVGDGRI